MGSKRVGLARTQALIENLKRDLDLKGSDMKLRSENSQMAVSEDGYGVYEAVFEVDFGELSPTGTDNGLLATVCTLPDNARILMLNCITSEAFSGSVTRSLDLVTTATADAADDAITASTVFIDGGNFSAAASGAVGSRLSVALAGGTDNYVADITEQLLVFINKGTSNNTTKLDSGKILVHIKYLGSGPATALTTVRGS